LKFMFYPMNTCGKELVDCLEKASADGKLPQEQYFWKCTEKCIYRKQRNSWDIKCIKKWKIEATYCLPVPTLVPQLLREQCHTKLYCKRYNNTEDYIIKCTDYFYVHNVFLVN